jgi:hypothetical protein
VPNKTTVLCHFLFQSKVFVYHMVGFQANFIILHTDILHLTKIMHIVVFIFGSERILWPLRYKMAELGLFHPLQSLSF